MTCLPNHQNFHFWPFFSGGFGIKMIFFPWSHDFAYLIHQNPHFKNSIKGNFDGKNQSKTANFDGKN
jgi:hypothetical protein